MFLGTESCERFEQTRSIKRKLQFQKTRMRTELTLLSWEREDIKRLRIQFLFSTQAHGLKASPDALTKPLLFKGEGGFHATWRHPTFENKSKLFAKRAWQAPLIVRVILFFKLRKILPSFLAFFVVLYSLGRSLYLIFSLSLNLVEWFEGSVLT